MSNLYKSAAVINKDKRVIDYNAVIQEKIEKIKEASKSKEMDADGFVTGLDAQVVEALVDVDGIAAITGETPEDEQKIIERASQKASSLIEEARNEAKKILEDAQAQAEQLKQEAMEQGYEEATAKANELLEKEKQKLKVEFDSRCQENEEKYQKLKADLEPQLVEVIATLFERTIHVISSENKDMVIDLINNAMKGIESGTSFLIRVSPEDYPFVINHQGKIYMAMSKDVQMDIIEDGTLSQNQCKIETDFGVYDCSLDIQMSNLIRDIKLLSCLS